MTRPTTEEPYGQLNDDANQLDIDLDTTNTTDHVNQTPTTTEARVKTQDRTEGYATDEPTLTSNIKSLKKIKTTHIGWLGSLAKEQFWWLLAGTVALALSSAASLVLPTYIGIMIDSVTKNEEDSLNSVVFRLFLIVLVVGIATSFRAYCFQIAGERAVSNLRTTLFNTIIVQEIAFFDNTKTGELLNRLSSDTKALESAVTTNVSMGIRYIVQIIGSVAILFFLSWKLSFVMLAVVPPIVIGAVVYSKYVKNLGKKAQDALAEASDVAEESISNLRTMRSFGRELHHKKQYSNAINVSFQLGKNLAVASGSFNGIMMFSANLAIVLVLWYGGSLIKQGQITIGQLTSFLIYTITLATGFGALSGLWFDILKALGATERVYTLVHRQPLIESKHLVSSYENGTIIEDVQGLIQFDNVEFSYPARKENKVLDGLNLTLRPGQVVALVGESGGGKSTTAALLQRFYDPDEGQITLDGVPITQLDPVWLRHQIGVVSQEPALFATTIKDNISYGRIKYDGGVSFDETSQLDIEQAAKEANAHEFVMKFAQGYDTTVGERGVRLSGGQKQRVAIARAILKDPKILILDEATSALDAESEFLVQQALDRLMTGRTVLIIAHRLSTVKNADCVCVVSKGKVVETGTHDELISVQDGIYKNLVSRQLQHDTNVN
ncbi:ABC transporter B family member ABCB1 [Acrasis kona]|uniref:ABC transporter B family member ABCB1 n=1 Tax=Acrasis kona TaxID=1008807 RepID=A0AAW2ZFV0_9EUKA